MTEITPPIDWKARAEAAERAVAELEQMVNDAEEARDNNNMRAEAAEANAKIVCDSYAEENQRLSDRADQYRQQCEATKTGFLNQMDRAQIAEARATAAEAERDLLKAERLELEKMLLDPVAVHINMLRGTIAKPSVDSVRHVYGAALSAPPQPAAVPCSRCGAKDMMSCDCSLPGLTAQPAAIREVTDEMCEAGFLAWNKGHASYLDCMRAALEAALATPEKK